MLLVSISYQFVAKMGIIAWYQANKDYVAKELCVNKDKPQMHCNGKCYLKKQLQKVDKEQSGDKEQPVKSQKSELPVFIVTEGQLIPYISTSSEVKKHSKYIALKGVDPLRSIFHPPPVC